MGLSEFFTNKTIQKLTEKLKKIEKEIQNIEDEEERKNLFLKKLKEYDSTLPVNSGLKAKKSTTTVLILAIKSNCTNVAKTILGITDKNLDVQDEEGKTALHHAIQQEVTEIVERSKQIIRIDSVGRRPSDKTISLQRKAIIARNINITQLLIEKISETRQTDIFHLKDNEGNSPLDYATADQSAKIEIEKLLSDAMEQSNRYINAIERSSDLTDTPLSRSYNIDDIDRLKKKFIELEETIKQFLEKSPGNIKPGNNPILLVQKSYNTTPLTLAIKSDCLHVAEIILEATNNNLDVQDNKGTTALHHAIAQGATDITKLLIEKILETGQTSIFRMPDNEGKTALDYSTAKDTETKKLLSDDMEQSNSGCFSDVTNTSSSRFYGIDNIDCLKKQFGKLEETIKKFLEEVPGDIQPGTNPILLVRKDYKTTPLILAIKSGYSHVAKTILRATNNNLDVQDEEGKTALHYAALNKDTETTKLLIKKIFETGQTDIFDMKDKKGKIALYYAIANQDTKIAELLSSAMVQSNMQGNESGYLSDGDVTETSTTYNDEQENNDFIDNQINTTTTEEVILTEEISDPATKTEEKDANNQQTDSTVENTSPKEVVRSEDKSNVRKIHQMENKTDSKNESKGKCKTVMLAVLITAVITASLLIYFTSLSALAITVVTCTSSLASGGISAILPTSKLNETECSNVYDGKNLFI